jgi:hypothetical protein
MAFEPIAEQKLELVVITNLLPVAQKNCIWKVILGLGFVCPCLETLGMNLDKLDSSLMSFSVIEVGY